MKIYLHKFYTEAHRRWKRGAALANALEDAGIEVSLVLDTSCDAAVCGAFNLAAEFHELVHREQEYRFETGRPYVRVVHLCWDLYPLHVFGTRSGMSEDDKLAWSRYVANLRRAALVVAPSESSARRMRQVLSVAEAPSARRMRQVLGMAEAPVAVALAPCDPWWEEMAGAPAAEGTRWVVDVVRRYDDPGCGMVERACADLGLPCRVPDGALPFAEFKALVAQAGVLVSAHREASTGGLTLVEGWALGKPCLASDSPWNGASEYLPDGRLDTFSAGDLLSLKRRLVKLWHDPPTPNLAARQAWVRQERSDAAYARRLAAIFKEREACLTPGAT